MGDLIYMFASLAERHRDGVAPTRGMKLLADTLHPHGVKITWIVSPESASIAADSLTRWHDDHGDDVAVAVPPLTGSLDEKKARVSAVRDAIRKALPWAELTIAGAGHTDPHIAAVLEDLEFEGIWGFCWEQIEIDEISDRGCPWGLYYMDREQRLRPARGRGPIGMEWTARDLVKGFYSGNPTLYSTDPNDVARASACSWEDIDYWKRLADVYIRNTRYNDRVFLLQHQEAHEMERAPGWECYTEEDIRESAIILDRFVAHLKGSARMMTLAEAARLYRSAYEHTASSYMVCEDLPAPPPNPDMAFSFARGPWPKTFFYYDRDAQMVFTDGKVEPICIRNYWRDFEAGEYFVEPKIPVVRLVRHTRYGWDREIEFTVTSPKGMPYGVVLWGDYAMYQIGDEPGLVEGKILPRELVFLRYNLNPGENRFAVRFRGK